MCLMERTKKGKGIVICGGGYTYFTNAWVSIRLLRQLGIILPVELWLFEQEEFESMREFLQKWNVSIKICPKREPVSKPPEKNPRRWMLKTWALMHSAFRHVLLIDADTCLTKDPAILYEQSIYKKNGALFWNEYERTIAQNPIWAAVGIPYRAGACFDGGQALIDTVRHYDPLELALQWQEGTKDLNQYLYTSNDILRFAFYKFGRNYTIASSVSRILSLANGHSDEYRAISHQDLDGTPMFQHRQYAKWNLLGINPHLPGFLHEIECFGFLKELRTLWNGNPHPKAPKEISEQATQNITDLLSKTWIIHDKRPIVPCCGDPIPRGKEEIPKPWAGELSARDEFLNSSKIRLSAPTLERRGVSVATDGAGKKGSVSFGSSGLKRGEWIFCEDFTLSGANSSSAYWWRLEKNGSELIISGLEGDTARLYRVEEHKWKGRWLKCTPSELSIESHIIAFGRRRKSAQKPIQNDRFARAIHIANHAYGIGDAITGLYVAAEAASHGRKIVYHTRFPQWLQRASYPLLKITDSVPPRGTPDMNADAAEQTRYAQSRVDWYASRCGLTPQVSEGLRPRVDKTVVTRSVDFGNYIVLAPFAAWAIRNWPEYHWRRLANLLSERGYNVIGIGTKDEEKLVVKTFDKSLTYWAIKKDDSWCEWVIQLMLDSQAVIGLDSGMVHLAGLLGVPTVSIHSHLTHSFLFPCSPSIFSVSPETSCVFCRWQVDRGYSEACDDGCSALATVGPEQVLALLDSENFQSVRETHELERRGVRETADDVSSQRYIIERQKKAFASPKDRAFDIIAYTYSNSTALAEAGIANVAAMRRLGYSVDHRQWTGELIDEVALRDPKQLYYHHWHPQPRDKNKRWEDAGFTLGSGGAMHFCYWAYEIEQYIPAEFRGLTSFIDEIWVPSSYVKNIFKDCGRPVRVLPHAVSCTDDPMICEQKDPKLFTVMYMFDAWSRIARKNPEAVISVFKKAFPERNDVSLVLKSHNLYEEARDYINYVIAGDPRISLLNAYVSRDELEVMYSRADVILALQRGEGFGLNIAKAMGRGIPVITTGYGGHLDFCPPDSAYLIPWHLVDVIESRDFFYIGGKWAEPNQDVAIDCLQKVEKLYKGGSEELRQRRILSREFISRQFSESCLDNRLAEILRSVLASRGTYSVAISE